MPKWVNPRQANIVNDDVDMIAMVFDVCAMISKVNLVGTNHGSWWIDTGATRHVCADKSMFYSFRAVDNGQKLYMGNSATAHIKGEGAVVLKMTSEKELKLTNVLYVPEIRKNLVSCWLLNKFGFHLVFESDKFVLSKNQMYVDKGYAMNGMFNLNVMVVKNEINKMNSSAYLIESFNVWHARLGHVNFNSMSTSFKSVKRKTEPLDMIHTDICDLKSLPMKGGNKYFITFIDDCTKYCYVYLLKSKDEAIDKFVLYKTEVENQLGKKIKIPRKDKEETPYELWMGQKPSYQYLRVWGCLAKNSSAYHFIVHELKNPDIQKNTVMESRNASFFEHIFPCLSKETGSLARLDDEVVQDKRQRDDNDLQDERQDQTEEEEVEPRRSKRARNKKSFRPDFVSFMVENEPTSYREAVTSSEGKQWREAIKSEIDSILQNHTWELVVLPPGCKPLGYKWIFKKKMKADCTIDKYKARLVIKGYRQREGLDYFDTYSPVTRITSIGMILAIAVLRNLEIHQMDVKTAFLNGDLEEEIYMNQPEGFIAPGQEGKVCRLVKSLYGLKQAHKHWHQKFDNTMLESGFKINEYDKYLEEEIYMNQPEGFIAPGQEGKVCRLVKSLYGLKQAPKQWHQKFDHTMLESGFKINECDKCVYVKDTSAGYVILCLYVDDMLIVGSNDKIIRSTKDMLKSKFDMKDMGLADVILGIKIIRTQNGLVLSQAHYVDKILNTHNAGDSGQARTPIDTSTRPDLAYAVSRLSRILDRLGGAAISWKSSKQTVIAKSTMESEFIALDKCGEEAEWVRQFVEDIPRWPKPVLAISIHCDSKSAMGRAQSVMYNGKSRHIRRRHNSIRQLLSTGVISIDYVASKDNIADPFTT
ncbi:retrovirus-related pol polyprotein from transposon TNT 1-94 [Tanacetum coccineum]